MGDGDWRTSGGGCITKYVHVFGWLVIGELRVVGKRYARRPNLLNDYDRELKNGYSARAQEYVYIPLNLDK